MEDGDQIYASSGEIFYKMQGPESIQIAVLGMQKVGKSALCMRFMKVQERKRKSFQNIVFCFLISVFYLIFRTVMSKAGILPLKI